METRNTITPFISTDDLPRAVLPQQVATQLVAAQVALQSGISWLLELGIRPEMPFYLKMNLSLVNRVAFVSLLLAFPGSFLLLLLGFGHSFSLLVCGTLALCLIFALNRAQRVEWALVIFAFFPSTAIMSYTLLEMNSGGLVNTMAYILVRQGMCLSLLVPIIIYGFEKNHRGIVLGLCVLVFLTFDVAGVKLGGSLFEGNLGMSQGLFSTLSLAQLVMLAGCVLYVQAYTMSHERQVRSSNDKLRHMAIRDGMTGLFNHTFIEQLIGDAINRSKRSRNPLSLIMIDIDKFKQINDSLGHNAGDEVLVHFAKLLQDNKRSTDYLGRWGGDELILLLTDTNLQGASKVAEKLRLVVDNHIFPGRAHLTISQGVCEYVEQDTPSGFIKRADAGLYRAKNAGRNQVQVE